MKAVHTIIHGTVQGVGFRAWVVRQSHALGLSGWVRNRSDGTVEAVFAGNEEAVNEMILKCYQGPSQSEVLHIEQDPFTENVREGFYLLPTL